MPQDNLGNITEETLEPLKVYWQPGCSSCLKTKEFLKDNGVDFKSVNVLEDKSGFEDLQRFGVKLVPVVAKGDQWANGAVFRDVVQLTYGLTSFVLPSLVSCGPDKGIAKTFFHAYKSAFCTSVPIPRTPPIPE